MVFVISRVGIKNYYKTLFPFPPTTLDASPAPSPRIPAVRSNVRNPSEKPGHADYGLKKPNCAVNKGFSQYLNLICTSLVEGLGFCVCEFNISRRRFQIILHPPHVKTKPKTKTNLLAQELQVRKAKTNSTTRRCTGIKRP